MGRRPRESEQNEAIAPPGRKEQPPSKRCRQQFAAMSAKNSQVKGQEDEGKLGNRNHISRRAESPQTRPPAKCSRT